MDDLKVPPFTETPFYGIYDLYGLEYGKDGQGRYHFIDDFGALYCRKSPSRRELK